MKIIVEPNLILRPIKISDVNDFYAFASLEKVTKFLSYPRHESIETTLTVIKDIFFKKKLLGRLAIEYHNKMIGTCTIEQKKLDHFTIGYQLNPQYWNKKITTKCVKSLLTYFFNHNPEKKVYIHAYPENNASWAIIKNLNFHKSSSTLASEELRQLYPHVDRIRSAKESNYEYVHDKASWTNFLNKNNH